MQISFKVVQKSRPFRVRYLDRHNLGYLSSPHPKQTDTRHPPLSPHSQNNKALFPPSVFLSNVSAAPSKSSRFFSLSLCPTSY